MSEQTIKKYGKSFVKIKIEQTLHLNRNERIST
jgi:hypothetical protein